MLSFCFVLCSLLLLCCHVLSFVVVCRVSCLCVCAFVFVFLFVLGLLFCLSLQVILPEILHNKERLWKQNLVPALSCIVLSSCFAFPCLLSMSLSCVLLCCVCFVLSYVLLCIILLSWLVIVVSCDYLVF